MSKNQKNRNRTEERRLKEELILGRGHICQIPGCSWEYTLNLHHINYDHSNNTKKNGFIICPNHHSICKHPYNWQYLDELTKPYVITKEELYWIMYQTLGYDYPELHHIDCSQYEEKYGVYIPKIKKIRLVS